MMETERAFELMRDGFPASDSLADGWESISGSMDAPELDPNVSFDVIGDDNRVPVPHTKAAGYPWRAICALRIDAADGSKSRGTGWLAGPRTVITAGHCVAPKGERAQVIRVIPALGAGASAGHVDIGGADLRRAPGPSSADANDYGAILLPGAPPEIGFFGVAAPSTQVLHQREVNIAGYPSDLEENVLWWHHERISQVHGAFLDYPVDTEDGQSGAPVWTVHEGQRLVVGIHTLGSSAGNRGVRITPGVLERIRGWVEEGGD